MTILADPRPFKLNWRAHTPLRQAFVSLAEKPLEHLLAFPTLNDLYAQVGRLKDDRNFPDKVLSALNVHYDVTAADLARIPRTGPVVVVANHPFGAIEGLILAALLRTVRDDVKIMANYLLECIPELRDTMIFVDPFGGAGSAAANLSGIKTTLRWVNQGGLLAVFPAGAVAHLDWQARQVLDPEWSQTVARIVRRTQAPVLPVFFDGANGALFQALGLVHPRLRTVLLPRELLNKRRTRIGVRIGAAIPAARLNEFADDRAVTAYLRLRTYILASRGRAERSAKEPPQFRPVAAPVAPARLATQMERLDPEHCLLRSGPIGVYAAPAGAIPAVLEEIGRLRELTFRGAHEGTGKATDLDVFDQHYTHLFLWQHERQEIIGAYRLGKTDEIMARFGPEGLYSRTLFHYDAQLLRQIGPALELGRSFIRPEYQRSYSPLLLLWKGIGRIIVREPRYKTLFGPVSISSQYQTMSQQLIMAFLQHSAAVPGLANLIAARHPPRLDAHSAWRAPDRLPLDLSDISALVTEVENNQRDVPILIKQYLKFGAKFLGFNVDPAFRDVLDGLMLVDLTRADTKIVERYMGREACAVFLAYHRAAKN